MKLSQDKIDKAYKVCGEIASTGLVSLLFVFFLLIITRKILCYCGVDVYHWECYDTLKHIYFTCNWIVGGISVVAFIASAILNFWATDEEQKQQKALMKEAMKELEEEKADKKRKKPATVPCPLIDLTEGQEKVIIRFLNALPMQSGHIKTSELKNMLHAMAEKGDLDDSDPELLADWVEDVTGKEVVKDKFKNEYKDPTRRNGGKESKWEEKIRKEFDKLR